jgi:hypothetical protein
LKFRRGIEGDGGGNQMKLDAKFQGEIRKVKDGSIVPEDQYVVFLAKDNCFADVLPIYLAKCIKAGCDDEHVDSVLRMIRRVSRWRAENPLKLKRPDAKGERLLDVTSTAD